jgi:hypothetical protein
VTSKRRVVVAWVATVTAGALLGVGSAWLWLTRTDPAGTRIGPWLVNLEAGSRDASMYTRARIALKALLALDRRETLYYIAQQDDAGRLLRSNCRYLISGSIPAARWWSVTAYADDIFLFPDAEQRYSVSGENPTLNTVGRFSAVTGPETPVSSATKWLPTPGDRGLILTLRLYNPSPEVQADPGALAVPSIQRQGECP